MFLNWVRQTLYSCWRKFDYVADTLWTCLYARIPDDEHPYF